MFRKIKDKIISKDLLDFSICRIVVYIQTFRTRWKVVRGHCVKRVPIRSFSGIRSEYGPEKCRIWTLFTLTYLTSSILQKKLTTFSRCYFRSVFLQNCKTLHSILDVQLDSEYAANIHVGLFFRNVLFFILNL